VRISRLLISLSVAVAVSCVPPVLSAQTSRDSSKSEISKSWSVPRTAWGDPDLQGLWPSIDMQGTPYERPENFGARAVLDDQEIAARETQTARQAEATPRRPSTRNARRAARAPDRPRTGASAERRRAKRRSSSIRRTDGFRP